MKILIVPFICHSRTDSAYHLSENMASVLRQSHIVAVCTQQENRFHHVSLFASPAPKRKLFMAGKDYSFETWLANQGGTSLSFLRQDFTCIDHAVQQFRPDLIITINRIAAVPAALRYHIPIIAVVHSSMYQKCAVPSSIIRQINTFLSETGNRQILRLKDLYQMCDVRLGFGTMKTDPYPMEYDITRIGMMTLSQLSIHHSGTVCAFFTQLPCSAAKLRKIISDTFKGASYDVYVCWPGCTPEKDINIHYLREPKESLLQKASVCIHDGSSFFTNICHCFAVPQIILYSTSCIARYNALSIRRVHSGIPLSIQKTDVRTLYEAYRQCIINEQFHAILQSLSDAFHDEKDLYAIVELAENTIRKR
ncbi:MAG: hypothetical protein ACI32N_07715 [Bulleidia sp.]